MWEQVIAALAQAAENNRSSPLRQGSVLHLPAEAEMILAGDLHGHGNNLLRIEALAGDLRANPARHVVLQELIHQIPDSEEDSGPRAVEASHRVVCRVARWQNQMPGRVHVILGNHELAQMTGQEILKWGAGLCKQFVESIRRGYGDEADDVLAATYDYFRSLPLAVRTRAGVAAVHSLPADRDIERFDATLFARPLLPADYERSGAIYRLLWGRSFGRPSIDRIKQALDARVLVLGHQPQPLGLQVVDHDVLIVASDHDRGVVLRIPGGMAGPAKELAELAAIRLASVPLD